MQFFIHYDIINIVNAVVYNRSLFDSFTPTRGVLHVLVERQVSGMLYLIGIGMFCLTLLAIVAMSLNKDFKGEINSKDINFKSEIKSKKKNTK